MTATGLITLPQVLAVCAIVEAATGLVLLIDPAFVVALLLGAELSAAGMALGRIAGVALLSLGLACWPNRQGADGKTSALRAMLAYNVLVTIYLGYLWVGSELFGILLLPAIAVHALLTLLLAGICFKDQRSKAKSQQSA